MRSHLGPRFAAVLLAFALVAAGCGGDDDDGPDLVQVPRECDSLVDALEDAAAGWPAAADLADLQAVNNDLSDVVFGLGEDCDPEVFARLDAIQCDYFTTVTPIGPAAEAFVLTQQGSCDGAEPTPDAPTATIEPPDATSPAPRTTG